MTEKYSLGLSSRESEADHSEIITMDSESKKRIKTWTIVGFVFSAIYFFIAILEFIEGFTFLGIACIVIGLLIASGSIFALKRDYFLTRRFYLIGGILSLPLGLVMIIASNIIKRTEELAEKKYLEELNKS